MAAHNSYNNVPYPAIDAKNFVGAHKGKVVFITGAGRGVGQGISIAFAKSGATLAVVDFTKDALEATVKQCRDLGVEVLPLQADVTNFAQVDAAIAETEKKLGEIDVLVNNAGMNYRRPFHLFKFEDLWHVIEVNFKAPLYLMNQILPKMRKRHEGCIINIASRSGTVNTPFGVQYASGKAALIRTVGCIQEELNLDKETNIHLYALHPGGVQSGIQGDFDDDIKALYPDLAKEWAQWFKTFNTVPAVAGQTCVYLATGKAKDVLSGKYWDCEQDIDYVVRHGKEVKDNELYDLKVEFVGLKNTGGTAVADFEVVNRGDREL